MWAADQLLLSLVRELTSRMINPANPPWPPVYSPSAITTLQTPYQFSSQYACSVEFDVSDDGASFEYDGRYATALAICGVDTLVSVSG